MTSAADDLPYCTDDLLIFHTSIREYVEGSPSAHTTAFQETEPTSAQATEPEVARRMRLNPDDFVTHGYTEDCPGCGALQTGAASRRRRSHTEACRIRME